MAVVKRTIKPEMLDALSADDPGAIRSRSDIARVHKWMGDAKILAGAFRGAFPRKPPDTIVELGAGDATFLLSVAKLFSPVWKPQRVVLVDRQQLLSPRTKAEFTALSWSVETVQMDIFDWLARPNAERFDLTTATLFLHHFSEPELRRIFRVVSEQTEVFLACEPERSGFSLLGASLLGFIGANHVTRYDGRVSVRAGFAARELSDLWPNGAAWKLAERKAGPFTHFFSAQRTREPRAQTGG